MITVTEAEEIISETLYSTDTECVSVHEAKGRILREDLLADRDLPPFDRSLRDGIGICFDAYRNGRRTFKIKAVIPAGQATVSVEGSQDCVEIMTGAVVPEGCDCIIPIEDVTIDNGCATTADDLEFHSLQFIHSQGADYKKGAVLVSKSSMITPQIIAVAASIGQSQVKVSKRLKIAIVSTGNELVDIDDPIQPFQIRKSNEYALKAIFDKMGFVESKIFHFIDDKNKLEAGFKNIFSEYDLMVSSGGVSMGKFDFLPEVLNSIGVKVLFHKIKQRPGKPMWFGVSKKGQPVFALPGNPVSTQILAYKYVIPYIKRIAEIGTAQEWVQLDSDYSEKISFTSFLPVKVYSGDDALLYASPKPISGSGDFVGLTRADGFIELPEEQQVFHKGENFKFYRF